MIKRLLAAIAIAIPTTTLAQDNCQIVEGDPDIKVCGFTPKNSPACHDLEDYPAGPQQLADFYGAQVAGYKYIPSKEGFLLTIIRPMKDGTLGSISLFHKGEPQAGVEPGTEACIVAIGSQVKGDPA
jgi:hypothetical protein